MIKKNDKGGKFKMVKKMKKEEMIENERKLISELVENHVGIAKCKWNIRLIDKLLYKGKICMLVGCLFLVGGWILECFSWHILGTIFAWLGVGIMWGGVIAQIKI